MTHEARLAGANAEQRVVGEFQAAGWITRQSATLDYGHKSDVQAVCPGRSVFDVQVSVGPKSVGEQGRLAGRGIQSLSGMALDRAGVTAPEYACSNWCERELCNESLTPIDTTPTPLAMGPTRLLYNGE